MELSDKHSGGVPTRTIKNTMTQIQTQMNTTLYILTGHNLIKKNVKKAFICTQYGFHANKSLGEDKIVECRYLSKF